MSTVPEIESRVLALENIYNNYFYIVPDFQREYVWKQEHVDQLLSDIYDEFYDEKGSFLEKKSEYFIGSIVVYPQGNDKKTYNIIDGQQRLTTCYLVLCVIRDHLAKFDDNEVPPVLKEMIISNFFDSSGTTISRYRLALQYEDSRGILENIASQKTIAGEKLSDTIENIQNAYNSIGNFLKDNFETDPKLIREFLAAFTQRVKLIQIITPNPSHALKIFETINHRGIDLDAMDLLKNLLFRKANDIDFDKIKDKWKILTKILEECKEKPLRFLRYYILSHYKTDSSKLKEDEVYDWFIDHSENCGIDQNPIEFVDKLIEQGKIYQNFVKWKDVRGVENSHLYNIYCFGHTIRQHFILLMAGQNLSSDLFNKLCFNIENLLFCSVITHVKANVFESNFAQWANHLKNVKDSDDLDAFLVKYFKDYMKEMSSSFDLVFSELTESSVQKYRLNYILAKLNQCVDESVLGHSKKTQLDQYLEHARIEHILPETPIPSVVGTFDKPSEYKVYLYKLGNLMLLEETVNTSATNEAYNTKKHGYRHSSYLLNSSIVEMPQIESTLNLNQVVKEIMMTQFDDWDTNTIDMRQKLLGKLAREVWLQPILGIKEISPSSKPKMACSDHNNVSIGYLYIENSRPILKCDCGKTLELNCDRLVFDTSIWVSRLFSDLSNTDFFASKTIFTPETVIDEINNWKNNEEKRGLYNIALQENKCVKMARDQGKINYEKIGKNASYEELIKKGNPDKIIVEDAKKNNAIIFTCDKDYLINPDASVIIYKYYPPKEKEMIELAIVGEKNGTGIGYYKNYTIFIDNAGDKKGNKLCLEITEVNPYKLHAKAKIVI